MADDSRMNEFNVTTPYPLCQVPMLFQSFAPVNLSLSQSLQQYSQIVEDMVGLRVFTENATNVLSQMLKSVECDLSTNAISAINTMLTIGSNIADCGNTYISRLKEKRVLLSHQNNDADTIRTIDSVQTTLVNLLSQARSLDMNLTAILQMMLQPSVLLQPTQVQQLAPLADLSLHVGVMPFPSVTGYQPNMPNRDCVQVVAPAQSVIGNRLMMPPQILVSAAVPSSTPENANVIANYKENPPSQQAATSLNQSNQLLSASTSPAQRVTVPPIQSAEPTSERDSAPEKSTGIQGTSNQSRKSSAKNVGNGLFDEL